MNYFRPNHEVSNFLNEAAQFELVRMNPFKY